MTHSCTVGGHLYFIRFVTDVARDVNTSLFDWGPLLRRAWNDSLVITSRLDIVSVLELSNSFLGLLRYTGLRAGSRPNTKRTCSD